VDELIADLGLSPLVNAAGKMTYLGGSACEPPVAAALATGSRQWVDMDELMAVADREIASATGAEAGFITACAAAGIAIATAACLTRGDIDLVERVPRLPERVPSDVLLQKPHAIHFGAQLTQMLRLGGGCVVEVGAVNRCTLDELAAAAAHRRVGAVGYVVSHHVPASQTCGLGEVIELAHAHDIPVIVDAAAETDLRGYVAEGADLVIYSGHKAIGGPTSGLVCGRAELIKACLAQNAGIGRAMKVGKESIIGALVAVRRYATADPEAQARRVSELATRLAEALAGLPGVVARVVADPTRPIRRTRVEVDPDVAGMDAAELVSRLSAHTPSIRCRAHHVAEGRFELDPRGLTPEHPSVIARAVRSVLHPRR
jgi:D-glucosaminate-6-phosphate ammonia-lyase